MILGIQVFGQQKLYIYKNDHVTLGAAASVVDSIYFSQDGATTYLRSGDTLAAWPVSAIDSLIFGEESLTILITYKSGYVEIFNPLAFEGVHVVVSGFDVTVYSESALQDINYKLSGTTTNGSFKIYSAKRYNIQLNGVNIANTDGPAINIQTDEKATIQLLTGTANYVTDGATYATPPNGEDQKGAIFSEAKLVFDGTGSLQVTGKGTAQDAINSDDKIQIINGNITVVQSVNDGIHGNDGIDISGGTIKVTANGDGIDAGETYVNISGGNITTTNAKESTKGISCDSTITISGGTVNVTVSGAQSKGIQCNQLMTLSGGTISITNSGDVVLVTSGSGYNPSYCTAIKSDSGITCSGANITINGTGKGSKSISSTTAVNISGGTLSITNSGAGAKFNNTSGVADAYVATSLTSDNAISITGGTVITSNSGAGGKGISCDGTLTVGTTNNSPAVSVTTTGTKILISGSGPNANYAEAKAVSCNGAINILNGNITIKSSDDALKSTTSITVTNATIDVQNCYEGFESPAITVNSGNVSVKSTDDSFNGTHGNGGENDDNSMVQINSGQVVLNASGGDGLDSNGDITMTGGTVIVHGPQSAPEVGMDYNGTCNVNGGFLVISGTNSNMTQAPSNSSTQHAVLVKSNQSLSASTLFHIQDASGNNVVTFQPLRSYYSVVISSSLLVQGATYSIYTGGNSTGTNNNGLYQGGTYSGGTFRKSFTVSSMITGVNF